MPKKIIDGKRYDSETATHVANMWNGYPRNDFKFEDKDLERESRTDLLERFADGIVDA